MQKFQVLHGVPGCSHKVEFALVVGGRALQLILGFGGVGYLASLGFCLAFGVFGNSGFRAWVLGLSRLPLTRLSTLQVGLQ